MTFGSWIIPISIYSPVEAILPNINFLPCLGPFFVILLKWVWGRKERSHLFLWHSTPSLITSLLPTPPPRDTRASVNKYHFVLQLILFCVPYAPNLFPSYFSFLLFPSTPPLHLPFLLDIAKTRQRDYFHHHSWNSAWHKLWALPVLCSTWTHHSDDKSHKLHLFPCADVIGPPEWTGKQTFTPTHESSIRKTGTLNSVSGGSYKQYGRVMMRRCL